MKKSIITWSPINPSLITKYIHTTDVTVSSKLAIFFFLSGSENIMATELRQNEHTYVRIISLFMGWDESLNFPYSEKRTWQYHFGRIFRSFAKIIFYLHGDFFFFFSM